MTGSTTPQISDNAPAAAQNAPARKVKACPECGEEVIIPIKGPGRHKRFCSDLCRNRWGNREKAEGSVIITLAKIWRKNRGSGEVGKAAFARMTEALDVLIANGESAGRPKLLAGGGVDHFLRAVVDDRYIDRRKR